MQTALANGPAALRAELTLGALRSLWQRTDARGGAFVHYLDNFLAQLGSDNTRRSYTYAILEFWDWFEMTHPGAISTPDRIERREAIAFSDWLTHRQFGLGELRLQKDPRSRLEAAIYAIVKTRGSATIADVRQSLANIPEFVTFLGAEKRLLIEQNDPSGLDKLLACLVEQKLLTRTPSLEELRRTQRLGLPGAVRVDPNLFTYQLDPHTTAKGAGRASTIVARLTALSSFWSYLIEQTGENTGQKPLLTVNVWSAVLKQMLSVASSHRAVASEKKTPDVELLDKLLNTTGGSAPLEHQKLEDVRDRALLLFLFYTGARADEMGRLRRSDLVGEVVTVLGKGRRVRAFRVPSPALGALRDLTSKIAMLAADSERQSPGRIPRTARLLRDDAPLFPAVARWGCNAYSEHRAEEPGLSRQAIAMMMRRRGVAAGIAPGSPEFGKLHPHGLRHLAAQTAIGSGTPVHVVQAVLGHKSLATTGVYLEERDPRKLSLFQEVPVERDAPEQVRPVAAVSGPPVERPAPRAPRPRVIETVGVSVPEAPLPLPVLGAPAAAALGPVPRGEGLVAIGALAPLREPLPSTLEITAAEAQAEALADKALTTLEHVYEADIWGEGGKEARQKLREGAPASENDRLTHAYIGKRTGLLWWDGATGGLRPQMPIAAPGQFFKPGPYGDLRTSLEALWLRRVSGADPKHPPSSAIALLQWVREAIELSQQVDEYREQRGIVWVKYRSPLAFTQLKPGTKPRFFRMHREDKIALWFQVRSQTYMTAIGRGGDVGARYGQAVDKTPPRPVGASVDWYADTSYAPAPWYDLDDPVAALPPDERAALLDWLLALTGQAPIDTTPRFSKAGAPQVSRVDLVKLLGLFCTYDTLRDDLTMERLHSKQAPELRALSMSRTSEAMRLTADTIDREVARMTGPSAKPFHVEAAVIERIAERKGLGASESEEMEVSEAPERGETRSRSRSAAYLKLFAQLFGKQAAEDPAVRLSSYCGKHVVRAEIHGDAFRRPGAPGAYGDAGTYADFFRVDPVAQTVVHTDAYRDAFTGRTGADSECVARRVARHLWEQRRAAPLKQDKQKPGELLAQLNTWAFYKVPCAASQELRLKERLSRLGLDSAASLLAILQGAARAPEEPMERAVHTEGESTEEFMAQLAEASEEAATLPTAAPESEVGETAIEREGFEEGTGAEGAAGYTIVAQGAGAKKEGFKEGWRTYEGMMRSTVGEGGGIGAEPRVLTPKQVAAATAAREAAEKERARTTAALSALTMALPKAPPRRRSYEPNARTRMDHYFENARQLVPGPITLLLWIYS